ncbi:BZ3500_MvSof-1268-A1-R1_Chr1-3g01821 [Microbotryum saponariae]|uniref:BZ3500_MvSof-1268-A1-R1_Chr1-3g01821 protein n=1 Tax=Microbotryum saponariae TaxID=289078 RepID=A0A2X0KP23_9BASI|nr:BZ3500_MvSof-1268-A1-R1_Chr1-3g01821 [Microbotryum saponariae]SCZ94667.1 BZ3501_MvSof-1269-A2-R1_Chr1-3g01423 [Microbotryum saponariae]
MSANRALLSPTGRSSALPSQPPFRRARSASTGPPSASSSGAATALTIDTSGAAATSAASASGLGSSNPGSAASPTRRPRSASVLSVQEVPINYDDSLDQAALTNVNAEWVNYKGHAYGRRNICSVVRWPCQNHTLLEWAIVQRSPGALDPARITRWRRTEAVVVIGAWLIHVIGIIAGIVILDIIPGTTPDLIWTIVNLGYLFISYIMFHYVQGVPFDMNNSGAYDSLTLWEQIDSGAQHTPAKKWLTTLPIALFLVSTHYTRYDSHPAFFTLNLVSLILVGLAPKLPMFHRLRFRFFDGGATPEPSAPATPNEDSITELGERSFGTFQ